MAVISLGTIWSDNQVLTATALNGNFSTIVNDYNGNITDANISNSANINVSKIGTTFPSGTIVGNTDTQTLTNKRITKRVTQVASSSAPTPNADTDDVYELTALTVGATFSAPSGTPTDGQGILIRIKDNGVSQTLAWNAIYRPVGILLPSATTVSKTLYVGVVYNVADSKWDAIAIAQEV